MGTAEDSENVFFKMWRQHRGECFMAAAGGNKKVNVHYVNIYIYVGGSNTGTMRPKYAFV